MSCNLADSRTLPELTRQGPVHVRWSTVLGHDQVGSITWRLQSSICFISYGRHAASPSRSSYCILPGRISTNYVIINMLTAEMNSSMSKRSLEVQDNPASIWMLTNGSATMNAATSDTALMSPFNGSMPPLGMVDVTKVFNISQTDILSWVINKYPYAEAAIPVLHGKSSDGWNANITLHLPSNSTIDIIMAISEDSMDTVSSLST